MKPFWHNPQQKNPPAYWLLQQALAPFLEAWQERLQLLNKPPRTIACTGWLAPWLIPMGQKIFPQARWYVLEEHPRRFMWLQHYFRPRWPWQKKRVTCVSSRAFFSEEKKTMDAVLVAGALMPITEWRMSLKKYVSVLSPEGLLMLQTLGPDSLMTLSPTPLPWIDMHTMADTLRDAGTEHIVAHCERVSLQYPNEKSFLHEYQLSGFRAQQPGIARNYLQPHQLSEKPVNALLECVYVHGFKRAAPKNNAAEISVDQIKRKM